VSRGHGASRRRSYGRRQHELRERRSRASRYPRPWLSFDVDAAGDVGEGGGPPHRSADQRSTQPGTGS
jgi:hypothetical protein